MQTLALVFDTETTGLWQKRLPLTHASQPRLVQLGCILADAHHTHAVVSLIVRPDDFDVPEDAAAIHGFRTEYARRVGVPLESALGLFQSLVNGADVLVCHNVEFDKNVLLRELSAVGLGNLFAGREFACTMKLATPVCKMLPMRFGEYKWPSLKEAYQLAFGEELDGAHDAFKDAKATLRLWRWLQHNPRLFADRVHEDKSTGGAGIPAPKPQHAEPSGGASVVRALSHEIPVA